MQKEMDYRRKECASSKVSTTKTAATEVMTRMASRVLSVFLTLSMALVMVLEALPALEAKAATEGGEWPNSIGTVVHISSASELKEYLSKLEDYTIVLDKDIDYHEDGEYQYWCTTAGAKVLDLNGHDIWISNDNQMTSTLFRIPVGCELILNDNAHSSDKEDVNILYNARVHSYDEVIYRNTFEVRGTLIQNGGYICAGRSKRKYYAAACEYAYQVMFGDGVQVYGGGLFVMNDGWLRGYGNFRNALYCNGGKAYINNGNVVGEYGAYAVCEGSAPGGKIRISAGTFETHEKDQVAYFWDYAAVDPNAKKKYDTTRFFARELDGTYVYGNYMLQKGEYDEGWKSYRDYYMTVAPKSGDACGFTVPNGEKCKASDSNSVFYLMDADKATLSVEKNNEYFQGIPENRANICGHVVNYLWRLYSGSEELASIVTQNNTINFAKDFNKSGFSVKTGRVYRVECQVVESLLDKVSFFHEKKSIDVALCLPEGSVEVNLDNFPDPYFMLYVHMMLDPNHDYILTSEELNAVTELNVGAGVNYEFTSLEGAQNFPYLQAIYAKGNPNLRSIDLGDMPFLMELDLEGCSIDSLNVSGCPNLRVLKLGKICDYSNTNGELTTLNITNCPLLEKLEIYQSKLQNIDISRCPLLVEAVLYGTEEEQYSLGFIEKKYAKTDAYVRTTYNNQQFFYVAKLDRDIPNSYLRSAVKSAYGVNDDNWLTSVEATLVEALEVDDCDLENLDCLKLFPELTFLNAVGNHLKSIDFSKNTKLETLYIDRNDLQSLDISMCPNLSWLTVSYNGTPLRRLDFTANTNLENLDATESGVTEIYLQGLVHLGSLDLAGNQISSLDIGSNTGLYSLNVNNNHLSELRLVGGMNTLYASNNKLTELDISESPNLHTLTVDGNDLTLLDISNSESLKYLYNDGIRKEVVSEVTGKTIVRYSKEGSNNRLYVDADTDVYDGTAPIEIVAMPSDFSGKIGDIATFTIVANGENIRYQWQQEQQEGVWNDIDGATTATLQRKITTTDIGHAFRCVLMQGRSVEVESDACSVLLSDATVRAYGIEFPAPGITAGESLAGLTSGMPEEYTVRGAWVNADTGEELDENGCFLFGGAYYLRLYFDPKPGVVLSVPEADDLAKWTVLGNVPDCMKSYAENGSFTEVFCVNPAAKKMGAGNLCVSFGLNPANTTEIQKNAAVTATVNGGTVTTYRLRDLCIEPLSYQKTVNGQEVTYYIPTQLMIRKTSIIATNQCEVMINRVGTPCWKKLSALNGIGFVGLLPNCEYTIYVRREGVEEWFYQVDTTTADLSEDSLTDGGFILPDVEEIWQGMGQWQKQLHNIEIQFGYGGGCRDNLSFYVPQNECVSDDGEALQNQRLILVLQKVNTDGTKVTYPFLLCLSADGYYYDTEEVLQYQDWNRMYAFLVAYNETDDGTSGTAYVSSMREYNFAITVDFDKNGGTGEPMQWHMLDAGDEMPMPSPKMFTAPAGKEFAGWEVDGEMKQPYEWVAFTKDTTVKAVWKDAISITVAHTCTVGNDLSLNYYIESAPLASYENVRLVVEKKKYTSNGNYTIQTKTISDYSTGNTGTNGAQEYKFIYRGLFAYEMGDELNARIVAEKDGVTYKSNIDTYSIKTYAINNINKAKVSNELKRLFVDMLNYGAQAQIYFNYNKENLVNAELTDAMLAYGTTGDPTLTSYKETVPTEGATARFNGHTLITGSNIELKYYMKFDAGVSMDNVTMRTSYTATDGTPHNLVIPADQFSYDEEENEYSCKIATIATKDFGCKITAGIYDGEKLISGTDHYSIGSYIGNQLGKANVSDDVKALLSAMGRYGKSAEEYFKE